MFPLDLNVNSINKIYRNPPLPVYEELVADLLNNLKSENDEKIFDERFKQKFTIVMVLCLDV